MAEQAFQLYRHDEQMPLWSHEISRGPLALASFFLPRPRFLWRCFWLLEQNWVQVEAHSHHQRNHHSWHLKGNQTVLNKEKYVSCFLNKLSFITWEHSPWPGLPWRWNTEVVLTNFIQILEILRISVNKLLVFLTQHGVSLNILTRLWRLKVMTDNGKSIK